MNPYLQHTWIHTEAFILTVIFAIMACLIQRTVMYNSVENTKIFLKEGIWQMNEKEKSNWYSWRIWRQILSSFLMDLSLKTLKVTTILGENAKMKCEDKHGPPHNVWGISVMEVHVQGDIFLMEVHVEKDFSLMEVHVERDKTFHARREVLRWNKSNWWCMWWDGWMVTMATLPPLLAPPLPFSASLPPLPAAVSHAPTEFKELHFV